MDFKEVPIGFGMALAQNEEAMNAFAMMTTQQKQAVWQKARSVCSKAQMRQLVDSIPQM